MAYTLVRLLHLALYVHASRQGVGTAGRPLSAELVLAAGLALLTAIGMCRRVVPG